MKIDPDSWHYKLYCFMSQWYAAWTHKEHYHEYPYDQKMIGLCPYMRMILIWGPIAILSNFIPLAAIMVTFFIFPAGVAGAQGVLWLFFSITALAGSIWMFAKLVDLTSNWRDARREEKLKSLDPDYEPTVTFWTTLKEYAKSFKTKICPIMELPDDQS